MDALAAFPNFDAAATGVTLVYSPRCGACKRFIPKFAALAADPRLRGVRLMKFDASEGEATSVHRDIRFVPTLAFQRSPGGGQSLVPRGEMDGDVGAALSRALAAPSLGGGGAAPSARDTRAAARARRRGY